MARGRHACPPSTPHDLDDLDGLPVVWASDPRERCEAIIKILERVAEAARTGPTWREELAARAQTAPDDGKVVALDVADDAAANDDYE